MTVLGGEVYPLVVAPRTDGESSGSEAAVLETVEQSLPAAPEIANLFLGASMQPQNTVIVRTAEQPVSAIGERMGIMRSWLDRRGIELADFELALLGFGSVAFDAYFRGSEDADLFWAAFG